MEKLSVEMSHYRQLFKSELIDDILSYWIKHSIEKNGEGFYGAADMEGNPVLTANKSCVLNARILWTFSEASIRFPNSEYGIIADRAFSFMENYFADKQSGGYFMELKPDNSVASDIKHT